MVAAVAVAVVMVVGVRQAVAVVSSGDDFGDNGTDRSMGVVLIVLCGGWGCRGSNMQLHIDIQILDQNNTSL